MSAQTIKAKNISIGLIAHVDAGKTTLSESLLSSLGVLRKKGRVDHKDSFLDYYEEERRRGITIFAKQAVFKIKTKIPGTAFANDTKAITLIDTPGHPELQGETERALMAMDYCIMLISAADGVTKEDRALWKLIKAYSVPVILFINKMDRPSASKEEILGFLQESFGDGFVDFKDYCSSDNFKALEDIASLDEETLGEYLESGNISASSIKRLISQRKLFFCVFGSALKDQGIELLVRLVYDYTEPLDYPLKTAGLCYKISLDQKARRLSYIKLTGGVLHPKDTVEALDEDGSLKYIKPDQIFCPNGPDLTQEVGIIAGDEAVLCGVDILSPGVGLGGDTGLKNRYQRLISPSYKTRLKLIPDVDTYSIFLKFSTLCIEFCEVETWYDDRYNEINVLCMGRLQTEVLKALIKDRYSVDVDFLTEDEVKTIDQEREAIEAEDLAGAKEASGMAMEPSVVTQTILKAKDPQSYDEADYEQGSKTPKSPKIKDNEALLGEGLKKDAELLAIFNATLGRNTKKTDESTPTDRALSSRMMRKSTDPGKPFVQIPDPKDSYLLVDGYNIIFAWKELSSLARIDLDAARRLLSDVLANYQAFRGMTLILVFDAYKVPHGEGTTKKYHNIYIVYTKEAETADAYIEKTVHEIAKGRNVTVATNDSLEQTISFGSGAMRMTARELKADVRLANEDMYENYMSSIEKLENRMKIKEK